MADLKALTLTQPWATLVALGVKRYETRSWKTNYRGLLAIHAALTMTPMAHEFTRECVAQGWFDWQTAFTLPRGAFVAVVDLLSCHATKDMQPRSREAAVGDWSPGRWAWELRLVQRFEAIEARGRLGLWTVPADLAGLVLGDAL